MTFASQSFACGGWLGVPYCSLLCVVSCTGGGLIRSTCLFTVACALDIVLWVSRLHVEMQFVLTCLPSVDFHWGVRLLGSSNPYLARLSMFLSVDSILMPEVDKVLVSYSSAIIT